MAKTNPTIADLDASPDSGYFLYRGDGVRFDPYRRRPVAPFYETFKHAKNAASQPYINRYSLIYEPYEIWAVHIGRSPEDGSYFTPFLVYRHTPTKKKPK